jgi:hypothetical protein
MRLCNLSRLWIISKQLFSGLRTRFVLNLAKVDKNYVNGPDFVMKPAEKRKHFKTPSFSLHSSQSTKRYFL